MRMVIRWSDTTAWYSCEKEILAAACVSLLLASPIYFVFFEDIVVDPAVDFPSALYIELTNSDVWIEYF